MGDVDGLFVMGDEVGLYESLKGGKGEVIW
jgi:hypothetical protein